jgi:S-adenosylmethionine hydrolase
MLPSAQIVDITHDIASQNIREGAFVLYATLPYYPGAVHIVVIDPKVGTQRDTLIIATANDYLVGPDNGVLIPVAHRLGIKTVYALTETQFDWTIAPTFHGRDIFAAVAVQLAQGTPPSTLGKPWSNYQTLGFGEPVSSTNRVSGEVIYIDNFGNYITNIPHSMIPVSFGTIISIAIGGQDKKLPFVQSYDT